MKCPRCETAVHDETPTCVGCGFGIADLDAELGPAPQPLGRLSDFAGMLSPEARARIEERLGRFEERTGGAQFRVVTRATTAPRTPAEYAFWLLNRWKLGDVEGDENRGLLVVLAQAERRIECEVGHGLEDILSDASSGSVLDEHVVPFLSRGEVDEGLWQAVDVLAQLIEGGKERPWWRRLLGA